MPMARVARLVVACGALAWLGPQGTRPKRTCRAAELGEGSIVYVSEVLGKWVKWVTSMENS